MDVILSEIFECSCFCICLTIFKSSIIFFLNIFLLVWFFYCLFFKTVSNWYWFFSFLTMLLVGVFFIKFYVTFICYKESSLVWLPMLFVSWLSWRSSRLQSSLYWGLLFGKNIIFVFIHPANYFGYYLLNLYHKFIIWKFEVLNCLFMHIICALSEEFYVQVSLQHQNYLYWEHCYL